METNLSTAGDGVEPRLQPREQLQNVVDGRFAGVHVLEDVGDVAAAVHHPALVQRLALPRGARHQLQLRAAPGPWCRLRAPSEYVSSEAWEGSCYLQGE